ncbi:MAG: SRPBCC domain-containing protein [Bacteroidia bacterium]|nr:SRPBCC domain-containing protein [Bacteroidia bacterium]
MEHFNWTTFTKRIAVKSTISDIYNAWTKAVEIEKWFLSKAVYFDTDNKTVSATENIKSGQTYEWSWYAQDFTETGKIIHTNEKDFIQFLFAGECIVEVKLSEKDGFVIVELTQSNIPTDDNSKQNIRLGCDSGWSFYLVNLKSVYEGGLDLRNKNTDFKAMVNN